jgi:putative transposase
MTKHSTTATAALWARFRFAVVGPLLSSPPARGELRAALQTLAAKTWVHPVSGREVHFSPVTIERWFYKARQKDDPIQVLRRAVRKDCGKVSLTAPQIRQLTQQYEDHPHWTYQLHFDNLAAAAKAEPALGPLRSYCTVRRYMQTHGLVRKPRARIQGRPGEIRAAQRREQREIRSYEAEYVGALWHTDFHHGRLKVLTPGGCWEKPIALGILDDHSRLGCHLQWYLSETTEDLVHGFSQGIQKRGLPRAFMTDGGGAMIAEEFTEGLHRLGIVHEQTLPYSPYQNGKQENFWATLEGRLMEMLDGLPELTLEFLNEVTQAWLEIEYNRRPHREIGCSPVERFAQARDVLRPSPSSAALRDAFRMEQCRRPALAVRTRRPRDDRREAAGRPGRSATTEVRVGAWREGTAAAAETHPRRVLGHGTPAGVPAQESA